MTPFDPSALLAMLLAFYPDPTPASLIRARAERPEYFAGGELVGRGPDAMRLPDGRIFDLIFDWDGLNPRWQVIDVTGGGGGPGDVFALEPGPLQPVDGGQMPPPVERHDFEDLLGRAAGELGGTDGVLALHESTIAGAATPDGLNADFERTVGAASGEVAGQIGSLHTLDVSDVIRLTDEHGNVINAEEREIPAPDGAPDFFPPVDAGEIPPEGPPPEPEV